MLKVKGQGHILVQMCGGNRHACWQWGIVKVPLIFLPWTVILSSTWTRWIGLCRCPVVWTFSKPQNVTFCFMFLMQVTTVKRTWTVVIQIHAFTVNVSTRWADTSVSVTRLTPGWTVLFYWILACRISVGMVPRVFQMPRTAHSLASVPPDTLVTAAVHIIT